MTCSDVRKVGYVKCVDISIQSNPLSTLYFYYYRCSLITFEKKLKGNSHGMICINQVLNKTVCKYFFNSISCIELPVVINCLPVLAANWNVKCVWNGKFEIEYEYRNFFSQISLSVFMILILNGSNYKYFKIANNNTKQENKLFVIFACLGQTVV